ncbi:MAG: DUF4131 domain-containing protein [Gammaproteobacteria bacterium]|nr:DUF4131 domain-containing protein [Gammaproteobacteria bacterium]
MRLLLAAWCCGLLFVQLLPRLPGPALGWLFVIVALALGCIPRLRWCGCLLAAISWAGWYAAHALERRLPEALAGQTFQIVGVLIEAPQSAFDSLRLSLTGVNVATHRWSRQHISVRLSWYRPPFALEPGMRCRVYVRLKPPRGLRNLGGFDAERWYFANAIDAIGYVVAHPDN